jgi:hypothetical protein
VCMGHEAMARGGNGWSRVLLCSTFGAPRRVLGVEGQTKGGTKWKRAGTPPRRGGGGIWMQWVGIVE